MLGPDGTPAGPVAPCCSPLYSSPEQTKAALEGSPGAAAAAATPAADMWSFGVVAAEVLSGVRFFGSAASGGAACPLGEVLEAVFGHRALPCEVPDGEVGPLAGAELAQVGARC